MDIEGVDVNMILPSGGVPSFCAIEDVALEQAMYQAYHRYPRRLLRALSGPPDRACCWSRPATPRLGRRDPPLGRRPWPVGIFPICPPELSLDDPDWEPIWAAAQHHDLTVVIHSFTMTVPYPPGVWDNWDNVFLQRAAGHTWNAQRNMAAIIGAGVLDRYPQLRLTSLECGHGWLAFWAARLDELAEMSRHALPALKHKPSEYIRGPQYFQSIQLHEGELSLRQAIEALGEDTLMFATDYPHSESWFPKSVDAVLGWTSIPEALAAQAPLGQRGAMLSPDRRAAGRLAGVFLGAGVRRGGRRSALALAAQAVITVRSTRSWPRTAARRCSPRGRPAPPG